MTIIIVSVIIVLIILIGISIYNRLVKLKNKCKGAWAQVDVQLQRRSDLIPNLVETVKGYAKHEKETLNDVISARNTYVSANGIGESIESSNQLTQALSKLMMLAENYPDLKANTNFLKLQDDLTETENKIAYARQFYNDDVLAYSNALETFPSNVIAGVFNFETMPYFKAPEEAKTNVKVEF